MLDRDNFKHNLRYIRISKGMSQQELADSIGVGRRSIIHWENGHTMPTMAMMHRIADKTGYTCRQLLREEMWRVTGNSFAYPKDIEDRRY